MLRKQIIPPERAFSPDVHQKDSIDIANVATVYVTSESEDHPIDYAFDRQVGQGGTRWIAGQSGEQTIMLAFDLPQTIRQIILEVEETDVSRTQQLQLALSQNDEDTYREVVRQEYNFSPPSTTFEREEWSVSAHDVTHLRLWIQPDKGGKTGRAALTSLILR